ncbi:MAG: hypothetical protein ACPHG7_01875 [Flavobacteriaceae bacterium]|jgi:hypothetical protein
MATYEEFTIDQGTDVAIEIHLQDENGNVKDLTNHTVKAQLRKNYSTTTATDFNSIIASPPTDGIATLSLTNTETAALDKGRYVYDVELSFLDSDNNPIIERILEGRIQVTPGVTTLSHTDGGGVN